MRKSDYEINPIIINRWSARAMSGETITEEDLMSLFEAARWAPSGMNNQLWRFIYAKRETQYWDKFFDLLMEGNKIWCKNAAVLILLVSRKFSYYQNKPHKAHSLEAGAVMQNLLLEAVDKGFVAHPMGGFEKDKAKEVFNIDDNWNIECMIAIGKKGDIKNLSLELQEREIPSDRKKINEIISEGEFNFE
ncbi:MAG: nitroreductase family protein [Candidatus Woesearchaeota archaeon]